MDPAAGLEALCYGGETLLTSEAVEAGTVGITSHRVLVLTPDGPGPRFQALDRPNVTGFASRTTGPTRRRNWGLVAGVLGVSLVVAGMAVDELVRYAGLVVVLVSFGLLAWYFWEAGWIIEIGVAGADGIRLPIDRSETDAVDRLEAVLEDARSDASWSGPIGSG